MIPARLFTGFLIQVIPFATLAFYPYWRKPLRFSKRNAICMTLGLLLGLAVLFTGCSCGLFGTVSANRTAA